MLLVRDSLHLQKDPRSIGCPNGQPDIQAACGTAIDNVTFLHEAYLGLTYQAVRP